MTWFHSFRADHGFTFYGDQTSPDSLDKPLVAVVYVCVLLSGATLIATLGIRGREKWSHAIRASYAVAIASSILLCLMSHNWMEGKIDIKAPFVYRSNMHFSGSLSVQIGLKSANITLDGIYMSPSGGKYVYYMETLPWPKYGSERKCYQHQLQRGLPAPVLRVMDFLTYQHGDLQWGKSYHTAGQYAWALLWTSFAFWLLSNLLLFSVVVYGAYMFFLAGVSLLMACVAYSQTLNPQPLHMTFGPDVLQLEYGWSFWLAIVAGCLTTILGVLLIVTDYFLHPKVAEFFHLEKIEEDEDPSTKEDHSVQLNKQRFYSDARGSLGSSQGDNSRRGSIFLEPSRQTKWILTPSKGNPFGSQGVANGNGDAKEMTRNGNLSPFKLSTRSKSEGFISSSGSHHKNLYPSRMMSVANDRKPSLATLKEHRENHVNEQKFNSTQSSNVGNLPDSNHSSSPLSRSLNDVNTIHPSLQRQNGNFIDMAAQNIRQRASAPTVLVNSNGFHRQESNHDDNNNNDNTSNSNQTIVEVVVENHHHHRHNNNNNDNNNDEGNYDRVAAQDLGQETGLKMRGEGMRNLELQRIQRNCDCSVSAVEGDYRRTSRSSGSFCSSPDGDDNVFTISYSRNSSRQASEGEEGEVVTSPQTVINTDTNLTLADLDTNLRKASTDLDRQISVSMGEI